MLIQSKCQISDYNHFSKKKKNNKPPTQLQETQSYKRGLKSNVTM